MTANDERWQFIAVHVAPGRAAERRVDTAIVLARWFGARLHGVGTGPLQAGADRISTPRWGVAGVALVADQATVRERFLARCASSGIAASEGPVQSGQVAAALVLASHAADLIVVTQPESDDHDGTLTRGDLEVVLRLAARPVLILPRSWDDALLTRRVLVGWDGSSPCLRAIADALPLLRRSEDIQLVRLAGTSPLSAEDLWWLRLQAWLRRHDVIADVRPVHVAGHAEHRLQEMAELLDPDLIVMGAYGHETWRAPWIGRTTRVMLERSQVPVLVAH